MVLLEKHEICFGAISSHILISNIPGFEQASDRVESDIHTRAEGKTCIVDRTCTDATPWRS